MCRARHGARTIAGAAALAAGLVAALVTPAAASSPAERVDAAAPAFYRPPAQLRSDAPGTLVRTAPYRAVPGARAWKVLYHSQALDGRDVVVSGVVVAPTSGAVPEGGRPVVSWAHGTHGIADKCAPSRHDDWVRRMPAIKELVARGYVVAATDYEGLGTPGVHPYLVGESGARGALDVVRAAQQIPQADASNETVVFGHSQGGQAALFAGEIAPEYAPDLDLVGVVAGAPAAEIEAMLPAAASLPDTLGFVVMGLAGAEAVYPDADRAQVLTPAGLEESDIVGTECYGDVLKAFRQPVDQVIAHNPSDVAPWPDIMARSTAGQRPTQAPLFVFQGMGDDIVYKVFTDMYVARSCTTGNTLLYRTYDGIDHYGEVEASESDIVDWIDARVAGEPAPTSC
jgi:pimeloyl-ACP methyl ester carboxylesterase